MTKTVLPALSTHLMDECQTLAKLWVLKQNNRRINITSITTANPAVVTTLEAHNLSVGMYAAVSDGDMTEIIDEPTGTWRFHEVTGVPDFVYWLPC